MRKLAVYTGVTAAVYVGLTLIDRTTSVDTGRVVARVIVTAAALGIAVPLIWTPRWRLLSLGLLGLFVGLFAAYLPIALEKTSLRIRPDGGVNPDWYIRIYRSNWMVGGVVITVYLLRWAWQHRHSSFPWFRRSYRIHEPVDGLIAAESEDV